MQALAEYIKEGDGIHSWWTLPLNPEGFPASIFQSRTFFCHFASVLSILSQGLLPNPPGSSKHSWGNGFQSYTVRVSLPFSWAIGRTQDMHVRLDNISPHIPDSRNLGADNYIFNEQNVVRDVGLPHLKERRNEAEDTWSGMHNWSTSGGLLVSTKWVTSLIAGTAIWGSQYYKQCV